MKKLLPSILPIILSLITVYSEEIKALIAMYPDVTVVLTSIYAILAHILPSPMAKAKTMTPVAAEEKS